MDCQFIRGSDDCNVPIGKYKYRFFLHTWISLGVPNQELNSTGHTIFFHLKFCDKSNVVQISCLHSCWKPQTQNRGINKRNRHYHWVGTIVEHSLHTKHCISPNVFSLKSFVANQVLAAKHIWMDEKNE